MNGRRTCFAHALLLLFAVMLTLSLLPRDGSPSPVAAGLFWAPYLPQTGSAESSMSARPSSGQAGFSPLSSLCPPRPGSPLPPAADVLFVCGYPACRLSLSAMGPAAVPILARNAGGRAPPPNEWSVINDQ